jgi:hypothetical protein
MKKIIYSLILITTFLYTFISFYTPTMARESGAKSTLEALIPGRGSMRIYGYTAPLAVVQASGIRMYGTAVSDKIGYFMFEDFPLSEEGHELCFTTLDNDRRSGYPVCVPLPETPPGEIGPILLAPTISLSQGFLWQNQTGIATGRTIPNSEVRIAFFEVAPGSMKASLENHIAHILVPEVLAEDLPILTSQADAQGAYSITLPSAKPLAYRLFAKAVYLDNPTPKSQTLSFQIGPITGYWIRWIFILLLLLIMLFILVLLYIKSGKRRKIVRRFFREFNEKRLKPFEVRSYLILRRLSYKIPPRKK